MRRFIVYLALVVVFSFQTGQIFAASIKTYAHVNIVPGAEALLATLPGSNNSAFALSGAAIKNVSVQVTTPDAGIEIHGSIHNNPGLLELDLPPAFLNKESTLASDRIITVVFE